MKDARLQTAMKLVQDTVKLCESCASYTREEHQYLCMRKMPLPTFSSYGLYTCSQFSVLHISETSDV